ncbi:hypothetical protein KSB_47980 [Ktedonobacter robiniae]|uniref:Uncharacterized protein n=1 Tax=Ktedonobacter robiniae TaxID=2778365 RepID=A0ABQ3UU79_9CHLR|nr:hypothetical protein KSB_47980 [Ktedonobacter robiniae]
MTQEEEIAHLRAENQALREALARIEELEQQKMPPPAFVKANVKKPAAQGSMVSGSEGCYLYPYTPRSCRFMPQSLNSRGMPLALLYSTLGKTRNKLALEYKEHKDNG